MYCPFLHCHLCGETHTGAKQCMRCHTDIYCQAIHPED
ncbi:putative zinc ribbon protein [Limnobaculum parvum]